jgi:hypothetical protein
MSTPLVSSLASVAYVWRHPCDRMCHSLTAHTCCRVCVCVAHSSTRTQ